MFHRAALLCHKGKEDYPSGFGITTAKEFSWHPRRTGIAALGTAALSGQIRQPQH